MAGLKLDGAGQAKMQTLEEAVTLLARINGICENYALGIKRAQPVGTYMTNLKRTLPALASKLKGQFGMIADQVFTLTLNISRGSSDQMRVRQMREGMALIKQALEIAITQVITKHEVHEEKKESAASAD